MPGGTSGFFCSSRRREESSEMATRGIFIQGSRKALGGETVDERVVVDAIVTRSTGSGSDGRGKVNKLIEFNSALTGRYLLHALSWVLCTNVNNA